MQKGFAELLKYFRKRSKYSRNKLGDLAGVSGLTIRNWETGRVTRPQRWHELLMLGRVLQLTEEEMDELLVVAGHLVLWVLRGMVLRPGERKLVDFWPEPILSPFQAIADLPYFVGRERMLSELTEALLQGGQVAICSVRGMGGVGKTVLAARLAYSLREQFPDGVLWARLDTSDTMSILSTFARAYGEDVSGQRDVESRAVVVRQLLADKRVLMVLDNAEGSEQVRPLLPPTTGKPAVLITTRSQLSVLDGMVRLLLEPFDPAGVTSLSLFTHFLTPTYVHRHQATLQKIAHLVGYLPLALAIVAGRLAADETIEPTKLHTQLQRNQPQLDTLTREDQSVRASFELSYQALPVELQAFFAKLGVFGGEDFGLEPVAYVAEVDESQAQVYLQQLIGLSLVQLGQPKRYRLHSLLRIYAREKLTSPESYARMMTHFNQLAHRSDTERHETLWQERDNILAGLESLQQHQLNESFLESVMIHQGRLKTFGFLLFLEKLFEQASRIALESSNINDFAEIIIAWGNLKMEQGYYYEAKELYEQARIVLEQKQIVTQEYLRIDYKIISELALLAYYNRDHHRAKQLLQEAERKVAKLKDWRFILQVKSNIAGLFAINGEFAEAEMLRLEILDGYLEHQEYGEACQIYTLLGAVASRQGYFERADNYFVKAMELAQLTNHRMHLIGLFGHQASNAVFRGDRQKGEVHLRKAIKVAQEMNHLRSVGHLQARFGVRVLQRGDKVQAKLCLEEAVEIARKLRLVGLTYQTQHGWAEYCLAMRRLDEAGEVWQQVKQLAEKHKEPLYVFAAHYGLARVSYLQGWQIEAERHEQKWRTMLEEMNPYELSEVRLMMPELVESL